MAAAFGWARSSFQRYIPVSAIKYSGTGTVEEISVIRLDMFASYMYQSGLDLSSRLGKRNVYSLTDENFAVYQQP